MRRTRARASSRWPVSDTLTADRVPPRPLETPQWLLQGELAMCPCGCIGKRKKRSFIEKTITGAADLLRQVMFSEDVALQRGVLQRVDPRTKIVGMLVLLVIASLLHNIVALVAMYAATVIVAG